MRIYYFNIQVAALHYEADQIWLLFKLGGYGAQADFAFKALQIGKKRVSVQLGNVLVRLQGAAARNAKALQLGTTSQISKTNQLASDERELPQIFLENIQDGFDIIFWDLDECGGFKLRFKKEIW